MFYISKRMEIAGAHQLNLPYESKCTNVHGHNWIVTVHCKARKLNAQGMIVDFKKVKDIIHGELDHKFINEVIPGLNPTAENMARWIANNINVNAVCETGRCYKVEVQESEGNVAIWEEDKE